MPKCEGCPNITNSNEGHHVIPLGYGGKEEGIKVNICGNCHTLVHQCIENLELIPPPALSRIVIIGRRAKELFELGKLEARDRRPTTLIPMTKEDEATLAYVRRLFNTKSKSETFLAALRFAAKNARRVSQ